LDAFSLFHKEVDVFLGEFLDFLFDVGVSLGFLCDFSGMLHDVFKGLFGFFVKVFQADFLWQVLGVCVDGCLPLFGGFLDNIGDASFAFKLQVKKK